MKQWWAVPFFILLTLFWHLRYQQVKPIIPKKPSEVIITTTLREIPVFRGQSQYFKIKGIGVRAKRYPEYKYGDKLKIRGTLTPDLKMNFPQIEKLESKTGNPIIRLLLSFRGFIEGKINQMLPEPQASLLAGILLGIKRGLPKNFSDLLRRSGTIHVVVVSGYNISVLASILAKATRGLGRYKSLLLSSLGVLLFVLMVGLEPPVLRAAIMGLLILWSEFKGRAVEGLRLLLGTAVLMLFLNPMLLWSISFQLSFLATSALLTLKPLLASLFKERMIKFVPSSLINDFLSTISAQVFVLPVLAYHFSEISLIAPLVNVLVLWVVPPIMLLGALTVALASFITSYLGVIGSLIWVPLTYFVKVVEIFGKVPYSLVELRFPLWLCGIYYLILGFFIAKAGKCHPEEPEKTPGVSSSTPGVDKIGEK